MKTTFKEENSNYVLYIEGKLDTQAASLMQPEVERLSDCWGHDIIIDCTAMDYISSAGLRIFLQLLKNAKAKHSRIYLKGLTPQVRSVLDLAGFTPMFEIVADN